MLRNTLASSSLLFKQAGVRAMATEKAIKNRIISTKSIAKITKSMKMVAAAKLKIQQRRLAEGDAFGRLFTNAVHPAHNMENVDVVKFAGKKHLFIIVTTDRGLCGGVNSVILRLMRAYVKQMNDNNKDFSIYCIGEKGKSQMEKLYGKNYVGFVDGCYPKTGLTFSQASAIAARICASTKFDTATISYNIFRSAIKYDTVTRCLAPMLLTKENLPEGSKDNSSPLLKKYSVEPEDKTEVMENMYNFSIATTVFGAMLQNQVCELSGRMNAMEASSKNAGEMIVKLTLQYNRKRQGRITTELIEIISGAESLVSEE